MLNVQTTRYSKTYNLLPLVASIWRETVPPLNNKFTANTNNNNMTQFWRNIRDYLKSTTTTHIGYKMHIKTRREYNGRHSNRRRNGQETRQENEELDSTQERWSTRILDKASNKPVSKISTATQLTPIDNYHWRMAEYRKTILLMKNEKGGAIPSNNRPITCLCTTFKLMIAINANTIQNHLYKYDLIP